MSSPNNKENLNGIALKLWEWAINALKRYLFEAKTKAVLDNLEQEVQDQIEKEVKEHFKPVFSEEPPKAPGSPAALLGGAMRLSSKWRNKK